MALAETLERWSPPVFDAILPPACACLSAGRERMEIAQDQVEVIQKDIRRALVRDELRSLSRRSLAFGLSNPDDISLGDDEAAFAKIVTEARSRADRASARGT